MTDGLTKVAIFFPTHSLISFWIICNLVINNQPTCASNDRALVVALVIIFCFLIAITSFTDTYTASNRQKYAVLLIPFYGASCFGLPTLEDKQRVYSYYFLGWKDFFHALVSVAVFILIALFTNPICMCLFPGDIANGTARFDTSIVRTIPIVVCILGAVIFMCLGEPRQVLGFNNVAPTVPEDEMPAAQRSTMGYSTGPGGGMEPTIPEEGTMTDDGMGLGPGSINEKGPVRNSMYPPSNSMARMSQGQPQHMQRSPSGRSHRSFMEGGGPMH